MRETAKPRGADEGRVSDGDRPIQQLTTAIPLLTRSLSLFPQPYSLSQSNVPFLFFPNVQHPPPVPSRRAARLWTVLVYLFLIPLVTHSLSLTRQIIRIRALTLPIPSDADRPQWQSVGTRK